MYLFSAIDPAVLETALMHLALMFLHAGGDPAAARRAAASAIAAYQPETGEEFDLATKIVAFGGHALKALAQSSDDSLPFDKIVRLQSSAASMSKEAYRHHRVLERLQRDRRIRAIAQALPKVGTPPEPDRVQAPDPRPEPSRQAQIQTAPPAKPAQHPGVRLTPAQTQAARKREMVQRMKDNAGRNQQRHEATLAANPTDQPAPPQPAVPFQPSDAPQHPTAIGSQHA